MQDTTSDSLSHDVAFDLLSSSRRRFVLHRLQQIDDGIEVGELSTELAAMENGVPPGELSSQDRKRIYVSLYQTHIPKLEDCGVVTYDAESGIVQPTDRVDELAGYFETGAESDDWGLRYVLVALGGLALIGATNATSPPLVEPIHVAVIVLIAIAILGVVEYVTSEGPPEGGLIPTVDDDR